MKNKRHLYVSPKNVLTWLMALCMIGSAVSRLVFRIPDVELWSQIILPIVSAIFFALITFFNGTERYYKTSLAVGLYAIYYGFVFWSFPFLHWATMIRVLYAIALVFITILYSQTTTNHTRLFWVNVLTLAFPLVAKLYLFQNDFAADWTLYLSDILLTTGMILPLFGVHFHPMGEYHPTWGDRPDGRRVRTLHAMAQVSPYIMVERNDASNYFTEAIEISNIERYIRQKRKQGLSNFGLMHVLMAAYCRGLCKYPALNRFLSGQKVYYRGQDVQFCLVIKKEMTAEAPGTALKIHLKPDDSPEEIYRKINEKVEQEKNAPLDSNFDNTAALLTMIPGVVLKFVVWLLKVLDYFGLLPRFLLEVSPFHGSVFFTSMGSLGIQPIYHHLYNFGNMPVFGSFGCKRKVNEVLEDGTVVQRKYVDCKFVLDERIADGYYYATFFKYYKRLLLHPELLDIPPEEVLTDIE